MKTIVTTSILILLSTALLAQRIVATESGEKLGPEGSDALSVMVYETDASTVEKEWKSLMKKHDAKVSESRGESIAENVVMEEISSTPVIIYSKTKKSESGTKLLVALSGAGDKEALKRVMENFARKLTKEAIAAQQREAEKEMEKAERKFAGLQRDNSDLHNDIDRYKQKIRDAEDSIKKNLADQEEAKKVIELRKKAVDAVKEKANGVF